MPEHPNPIAIRRHAVPLLVASCLALALALGSGLAAPAAASSGAAATTAADEHPTSDLQRQRPHRSSTVRGSVADQRHGPDLAPLPTTATRSVGAVDAGAPPVAGPGPPRGPPAPSTTTA